MSQDMLGGSGEDLGLIIDFTQKLRHGGSDFREAAKKFLRKTLVTLTLGDGQTKTQLLAAYNWVSDVARAFVMSEQFRMAFVREDADLEFVEGSDFDHDPSSEEVLTELKRRGLEEPTEEDALRYGATCPEGKDKRAVVFLHKANLWRDPGGHLGVLVFDWGGSKRYLGCYRFDDPWYRQRSRFAGRRPRK
ncbi:hypothetical protein HZC00_01990 [Candidatus Kaiserbacteria bacterium]|nr:hypothetical protein [Candidatus Kaiserbacteria bacterium]